LIKVINKIAESSHQFAFQNMSSIRTLVSELLTWEWLAILFTRLAVGLLFFLSGRGKVFVAERREQMRQTLLDPHVPFPDFNTAFVSMVEFVFGSFLVLGFATPLVCVMLVGVMIVGASRLPRSKISERRLRSTGSRNFYTFQKCSV
jgi:uncharacterized membrane protein YphA (DoxX/SURF4 family)